MQAGAETDAALIEASGRRECGAFAKVIERYQRAVYAVAFSGVRDRALADDITQETFVIAWRQLDELRDATRLPAWLCGIARNLARDTRKRLRRETLGEPVEPIDASTPYEAMNAMECERIVATALGQVPDVYREPLVLYYYEERSIDDVARSLGISAATTNKRLSRGRRCLKDHVADVLERGLATRGPSPTLAASVLAIIGITASASHVDASPTVKGSTMHKFAIAAFITAAAGGVGAIAYTATRGDAHAARADASPTATTAGTTGEGAKPAAASGTKPGLDCNGFHKVLAMPSLAPSGSNTTTASASASAANDCAAVGRHLAELEADVTHGPSNRPDDATCDQCAGHYTQQCETDGWSIERRVCALAAGDLMNAHLCAGGPTVKPTNTNIPPALSCATLGTHIAATVQAAGLYPEVQDMGTQLESACEMGGWPTELRQCFAAATSVNTLQACVTPPAE